MQPCEGFCAVPAMPRFATQVRRMVRSMIRCRARECTRARKSRRKRRASAARAGRTHGDTRLMITINSSESMDLAPAFGLLRRDDRCLVEKSQRDAARHGRWPNTAPTPIQIPTANTPRYFQFESGPHSVHVAAVRDAKCFDAHRSLCRRIKGRLTRRGWGMDK
jgi:hypothetical protein